MNGVIETATGDLLRMGYCDFENDGSFDAGTQTYKTDIPEGSVRKKKNGGDYTNWNGSAYVTISRTPFVPKDRSTIMNEVLSSAETAIQLPRLLDALDKYPSVAIALDNFNYTLASARIQKALTAIDIEAVDKTLIECKFPTGWGS